MISSDLRSIHRLFEAWAAATPNAKAVVCDGVALTYSELDARADRLAQTLRNAGVERETPVGLCVDRSLEMIVGMLGILKASGAYVPLAPSLPAERLAFMLEDSGAALVLAPERLRDILPVTSQRLVTLESASVAPAQKVDDQAAGSSLAYIIYTSGSTGRPKGVEVAHASAANLLTTVPPLLGTTAGDVWTVYHSFAFDLSVWEIWTPLTSGGTLVIVPDDVAKSPIAFAELLRREQVTVLNQTPSALVQLVTSIGSVELNALPVRVLICGGDAFPVGQVQHLRKWDVELWNFYGPTEATVWSTIHRVDLARTADSAMVPLGDPIPNTRVHLLDGELPPASMPVGLASELAAGGWKLPCQLGIDACWKAISVSDALARSHRHDMSNQRHWYLFQMAVAPAAQRHGVGRMLLADLLARADADGVACYLETFSAPNVDYYRSHGFGLVGQAEIPTRGTALPFWHMLRPAAA